MEVYYNGLKMADNDIQIDESITLNKILQQLQEKAAENKETIVKVLIDDVEHNLDFYDDENDMDVEFIDKIEIFTESVHNVSENVINEIEAYLIKVYENIEGVANLFSLENKLDGVNNFYDVLEGLKFVNIAFNSLKNLDILDLSKKNEENKTFVSSLVEINQLFLNCVELLKQEQYEELKEVLVNKIKPLIKEILEFFPNFYKDIDNKREQNND